MNQILTIDEIKQMLQPVLAAKEVKKASIFGSYAKGTANVSSDVDIVVEFLPVEDWFKNYNELLQECEKVLDKSVDLADYDSINPFMRLNISLWEVPIYECVQE